MLLAHSTLLAIYIGINLVSATPVVDLTVRATAVQPALPAVTHYYAADGSKLATIKSTDVSSHDLVALAPLVNDQVITAAFETVAKITEVVCTKAGPYACVATGIIATIGTFFLAYTFGGKRDAEHIFQLDFPPLPGVSTRYRLENEAEEGDWRVIGNATIDGVFHSIHYKRNGTLNGLRSIQYGSVEDVQSVKRAEDDYGGVVVDYNWNSLSENAYDSFHSTQTLINDFGNDIAVDFEDANSIQGCADFADSDGYLDGGLVSIGWNNQPFQFDDGQEQAQIDYCESV